jgi:putative Ca2+/H+ antiporter (TMEM165/GDT1 family)
MRFESDVRQYAIGGLTTTAAAAAAMQIAKRSLCGINCSKPERRSLKSFLSMFLHTFSGPTAPLWADGNFLVRSDATNRQNKPGFRTGHGGYCAKTRRRNCGRMLAETASPAKDRKPRQHLVFHAWNKDQHLLAPVRPVSCETDAKSKLGRSLRGVLPLSFAVRRFLLWFFQLLRFGHKYAALRFSGVPLLLASAVSPETSLVGAAVTAARGLPVVGPACEAFALVFFSEFGDKSMFSTALLSMRYGTRSMQTVVLLGSMAALTTMTFISCFLGRLMSFLPTRITLSLSVLLLTVFGVRFLQQAIAAWRRDRTRRANSSTSGVAAEEPDEEAEAARDLERYKISIDDRPLAVFMKSFTIIALAEWCDRSMFATMALAASTNAYAVIIGASLANLVCTGMAVAGGSLFHKLPERIVNFAAGTLFLATAAYTWFFELPETDS